MNGIKIGRSREIIRQNGKQARVREAKVLFGLGCAVICIMLVLTVGGESREDNFADVAVPAMSSGVVESGGEELKRPERDTAAEVEDWSIYDYIGHMIAELLFGEG